MHRVLALALFCCAIGCDDADSGGSDAAGDAEPVVMVDAARPDAALDAGPDAALDGGPDALVDGGPGCVPDCADRVCGSDGCGGECGACAPEAICGADGQCTARPPACGDDVCSADESCSTCPVDCGNCCGDGQCAADETCVRCAADCGCADDATCNAQTEACEACVPQCEGRACGPDGCGGTCGACPDDVACEMGQCAVACQPDCADRTCGDDGCGGVCGMCAANQVCDADGRCAAAPPRCGDDMCTADEDCATCAEDCGACCGDGVCGAGETCATCAEDCACAAGERCDAERRACVPECVPQCNGRNCGDDGCGGVCGDCEAAQACEAGVCVDVCQPDCTGRVCGGDGCGGRCGECEMGSRCAEGQCEAICQPDCAGRVCGDDGCGGVCGVCEEGSRCAEGQCEAICQPDCAGRVCGDDGCGGVCGVCEEGSRCAEGQCEAICQPDCAGRVCGDDGCGGTCGACGANSPCTAAGQCAPDGPIDASGTYERETVNGDDSMTIRVAEPVVFAAIPGGQNPCGLHATMELAQGARLLGNAISLRGANECGRILTVLEPGDYTLRFFSDRDPIARYPLRIAMTPLGPDVLPGSGTYGRRGVAADAVDAVTMQVDAPSILRMRIDGGLGRCVTHTYTIDWGTGSRGPVGPRCFEPTVLLPIPPGPLTLTLQNDGLLSPYVLHVDVEPIPNDSTVLPRSTVLRQTDRDMVFVELAVPAQVDFALQTPDGQPCNVLLQREVYAGYRRSGAVENDQPCRWSRELAPGIHGYAYRQANGDGAVFDRRVTITPLSNGISAPGRYPRPVADAPETLELVLNAPQAVRIFAEDEVGCITQPMTLTRADGARIDSVQRVRQAGRPCDMLTAMVPAGTHQLERTGQAGELVVDFGPRFDGSQTIARGLTDWPGDVLALHGPAGALLYLFEHDGTGACVDQQRTERYLEGFDQVQTRFACFPIVVAPDGPVMLRSRAESVGGREIEVTPRSYDAIWSPIEAVPVQSVRPARVGLDVLTVQPPAGLMTITTPTCEAAPSLARADNEGDGYPGATSPCGTIAALTDAAPYRIERVNPVAQTTWSVQMVEDVMEAPELRPLPRTAPGGTHALVITVERAGVLHARFDTPGGPCRSFLEGVSLFSTSGARATVIDDCEASLAVEPGDRVGVLVAAEPEDRLTGSLETFFE